MINHFKIFSVTLFTLLSTLGVAAIPVSVHAAWNKDPVCNSSADLETKTAAGCDIQQDANKTAPNLAVIIINVVIGVLGVVSVAFIIYSGFRYITAQGDPSVLNKARNGLIFSAIGLVVALLSFAVVNFISNNISV